MVNAGHAVMLVAPEQPERTLALEEIFSPEFRYGPVDGEWQLRPTSRLSPELHPDLTVLLSTSGSTGSPKLVRLSAACLEANARSIAEYLAIDGADRAITSLPPHYSYGLSVINSHLLSGAALVLTERSVVEPEFRALMQREGVTSLAGVPYQYELLDRLDFLAEPPAQLRTMTQAGGRLAPELVSRFAERADAVGIKFFVMYGQTEATARMAYVPPEVLEGNADAIGVPIPGGAFRLIGEDGSPVTSAGMSGELVYTGDNVMLGYATSASDLAAGRVIDELRTGDLATRDVDGIYRIVGRLSRFIKPLGLRIGLDDVERICREHGYEAAATGTDQLLCVRIAAERSSEFSEEALASRLGLPASAVNLSWGEIPRLPSGKVDYVVILRNAEVAIQPKLARQPASLIEAFERTFRRGELTKASSFTSLGGDSLNYVTLSLAIEEAIGHLPHGWENLSIRELEKLADHRTEPSKGTTSLERWFALRPIESEVAVRAAAILAIVVNHASAGYPVSGGAIVLLLLFGFNLSKYQRERLVTGRCVEVLTNFVRRVALPYYCIMIVYYIVKHEFNLPAFLLVSNYVGRFHSLLEPYWFIELLAQLLVVAVVAFAFAPVRRLAARDPWLFGLYVLGSGALLCGTINNLIPRPNLGWRTPELLLWVVGLGWCAQQATNLNRKLTLSVIVAVIVAFELFMPTLLPLGNPTRVSQIAWLIVSMGALLWIPHLAFPRLFQRIVAEVAALSFYIYLAHVAPIHIIRYELGIQNVPLMILLSIAAGAALRYVIDQISRLSPLAAARPSLAISSGE